MPILNRLVSDSHILRWLAALLTLCSLTLAWLIGQIGFQGDDWWQFSWAYWNPFPRSFWEYAAASRRPIEGLYTVLSFDLFGLNRFYYTVCALLLLAASSLTMGACLKRAFPKRESMVVLAVLFGFLLPPVSNLVYMFHTDNSRLSLLLFWLSVASFQRWAGGSSSWSGLVGPVILYCLATLTYENTTFLVFVVPLLVLPVHVRARGGAPDRSVLIRLAIGVLGGFAAFVATRFLVFGGGAVGHSSLIPPLSLIESYVANMMRYVLTPFLSVTTDHEAWAWGVAVAAMAAGLLFLASVRDGAAEGQEDGWMPGASYIAVVGLAVLGLGMLPYLLAGYDPPIGFASQSRVYSSATFGLGIVLAVVFTACKPRLLSLVGKGAAIAFLAAMAIFLAGLKNDWQVAALIRDKLCFELVTQIPDVADGTTFLFLNLQDYLSRDGTDRAVVHQGVDGLGEFIKMLYRKKDVYAYFLYPSDLPGVETKGRRAAVSPAGLVARGSAVRPPVPLDSLLIFKRDGDSLKLLDRLCAEDGKAAIDWNGINEIRTNRDLIRSGSRSGKALNPHTRPVP